MNRVQLPPRLLVGKQRVHKGVEGPLVGTVGVDPARFLLLFCAPGLGHGRPDPSRRPMTEPSSAGQTPTMV